VSGSIGLLSQLYVFDSHNVEAASQASSNMEMELATTAVIARCIDAVINVLGPDLQDMTKPRDMVLTLMRQLQGENDPMVVVETMRCFEHVALYTPGHMEFAQYVRQLQYYLGSPHFEIREAALAALAELMKRDTQEIVSTADTGLEDTLWDLLDREPDHPVIRGIFRNWLQQTVLKDTVDWIQRCSAMLTKSKARPDNTPTTKTPRQATGPDIQDDEIAGFAAAAGTKEEETATPTSSLELMRWRVRLFAMDLLATLLAAVSQDSISSDESPALSSVQQHLADVIRIAFSASTAGVVSLRVRGLRLIDQILKASRGFHHRALQG